MKKKKKIQKGKLSIEMFEVARFENTSKIIGGTGINDHETGPLSTADCVKLPTK